jgi:membrane protein DedA with SNARE-associated domain
MGTLASGNPSGTPLPGFLNSLAGPLEHWGYWAIALLLLLENIGVPVIPGETALIAGAIFAGTGRAGLNVAAVGVVAVTAAVAGAQIGYLIGRFAGRELILRYGKYVLITPRSLDRAEAIVDRYGGVVVVIARFIVGLREANGIIAGATKMRWVTFGFFNVAGACAWVAAWLSAGYAAGDHIGTIYDNVSRFGLYLLLALAVLLAGYIVRRVARRYRRSAKPQESSGTQGTVEDAETTVEGSETVKDSETVEDSETESDSGTVENSGTVESSEASEAAEPSGVIEVSEATED